ncbi:MAG: 16S rRNA (adenine(1518)-N(6)/adenine(1519)-N(6))-dimethyltransferase RsmA [Halarsenatibacteraceae bacterium]
MGKNDEFDPVSPTGLKSLLKKHDLYAKKSFGQNFLVDGNILDIIIESAGLEKNDKVIEVGPGLGALTVRILEEISAGELLAVEKDRELCSILENELSEYANFSLIEADILEYDLEELLRARNFKDLDYKLMANLPYNITSPLIRLFLERETRPEKMVLMVQREVAERIVAEPGGKDFGTLSIAVQYYAEAEIVHYISPEVFIPQPRVESAIITLDLKNPHPERADNEDIFFKVVRAMFQQRRKIIRNSLSKAAQVDFPRDIVDEALARAEIDPKIRGEKLSIQRVIKLSNELAKLL